MKKTTILHVPHASVEIPERYARSFCKAKLAHELDVMTDWFCDELFDCGRDMLVFPISRLVCDVERFRNDKEEIMAKVGMGVTYIRTSDLGHLRTVTESEKQEILSRYYDAHHEAFAKAVEERINTFGHCLIIDCHSFHPTALPYEICLKDDRPDFCIGTSDHHTPKKIAESLIHFLSEKGYSVNVDSPFSGTIVPMKYYEKDKRVRSVMIEVNRKLYMDAPSVKSSRFSAIRQILKECIEIAEEQTDT